MTTCCAIRGLRRRLSPLNQHHSEGVTPQSSSLRLSETGSKQLEQRQLISSLGYLGRTDTAKASTGKCETNC